MAHTNLRRQSDQRSHPSAEMRTCSMDQHAAPRNASQYGATCCMLFTSLPAARVRTCANPGPNVTESCEMHFSRHPCTAHAQSSAAEGPDPGLPGTCSSLHSHERRCCCCDCRRASCTLTPALCKCSCLTTSLPQHRMQESHRATPECERLTSRCLSSNA